jgi:hypothetical protein
MKRALLTVALLLALPAVVAAQTVTSCPGCVLGVYDSSDTRQNYGYWDASGNNAFKELFISIDFDPGSGLSGLTGIELSISGLPSGALPPSDEWFPSPAAVLGSDIRTPADTTGTAEGGKNIAWDNCLADNRNLGKITMISVAPVGTDRVIRILHRFPPQNPEFPHLLFNQCDAPAYTKTAVTGGCYVLNPTPANPCGQTIGGCLIRCTAVEPATWSGIKRLYR